MNATCRKTSWPHGDKISRKLQSGTQLPGRFRLLRYARVFIVPALKPVLLLVLNLLLARTAAAQLLHYTATNLWQAEIGVNNRSSPAMDANGVIYVTTFDGQLLALNPEGNRQWTFRIGFESIATPAVGTDGTIYFGSRNHRFYAVSPMGQKQWEFKTSGWIDASAALADDGTVFFGSWDKNFYAVDKAGQLKWKYATGGPITSSAAIDASGILYFGSHDRKFYALNPDGAQRWVVTTGGAILSSPAIAVDGTIYFSSTDGTLCALNPDGQQKWRLHTGSIGQSSPVLGAAGTIFIAANTNCYAVNPDGSVLWQWPIWNKEYDEPYTQASWTALDNGNVLALPSSGLLVELTGKDWIWQYSLRATSHSSPLVNHKGIVYAMGFADQLSAIQGSAPIAKSSWPMFRGNAQRTGRVTPTQ